MLNNIEPVSRGTSATSSGVFLLPKKPLDQLSTALDEIYGAAHRCAKSLAFVYGDHDPRTEALRQIEDLAILALNLLQPYLD